MYAIGSLYGKGSDIKLATSFQMDYQPGDILEYQPGEEKEDDDE